MTPPQPIPNPRMKELLDQKDNWVFITPEDMIEDFLTKESLKAPEYGPDGREKSSLSVVERYYERMSRTGNTTGGRSARQKSQEESNEDSVLPGWGSGPWSAREFSDSNLDSRSARPNSFSDLLGANKNRALTPEALRAKQAQEQHTRAFQQIWESTPPAAPGTALPSPGNQFAFPTPARSMMGELLSAPAPSQPKPYATLPAAYQPSWKPASSAPLAPTTPSAPGRPDYSAPQPSLGSTKLAPPKIDFAIPQRKF